MNLFYELAYHLYLLMFVQIAGSQRTADQALPSCIFQVCAMLFKHNIVCSVYDRNNRLYMNWNYRKSEKSPNRCGII